MELIKSLCRNIVKYDWHVVPLLAAGWGFYLAQTRVSPSAPDGAGELYSVGAPLCTFLVLKSLGYFSSLRLVPRKSDVVLVLSAFPGAGLVMHAASLMLYRKPAYPLSDMLLILVPISIVVFACHYLVNWMLVKAGRRLKVVLDVLPAERASLIQDFNDAGDEVEGRIVYLTKNDLREAFLKGAEHEIDLVIISQGSASKFEIDGLVIRAHLAGIPVVDAQRISMALAGRIRLSDVGAWSFMLGAIPQTPLLRAFTTFKTLSEPLIAAILGVLFLPVIVVLAVLIKTTSKGPIFYRQVRTGYLGKNFTLVKFRSMTVDAEANGPQWASANDSRVTPIGGFMRKTRLDELPQLWNVIRGEMGFFGPRPERPEIYRELKKEIPLFSLRTVVRPGITGWAQVCAGYAASVAESATKLEYDLYYIQNMSPRLDFIILIKTIQVAILGDKAAGRPVDEPETIAAEGV